MSEQQEFHTLAPESLAPAQLLRSLGLQARKHLGQNFLASTAALRQILLALEISYSDIVVEIGAGLGTLTGYLVAHASQVVAIELDDSLASYLENRFQDLPGFRLVHGDVLTLNPDDLLPGREPIYKVVGNLPYYITSAAIRHLLSWQPLPALVVVMVQEEVAQRMTAGPGDMSLLSLMVQLSGPAEIVARVPAGAFIPRPKVDSAIIRIIPIENRLSPDEEEALFHLARAAFQQRRKTLLNSLSGPLSLSKKALAELLESVGISPIARPQSLSLDQWRSLAGLTVRRKQEQANALQ